YGTGATHLGWPMTVWSNSTSIWDQRRRAPAARQTGRLLRLPPRPHLQAPPLHPRPPLSRRPRAGRCPGFYRGSARCAEHARLPWRDVPGAHGARDEAAREHRTRRLVLAAWCALVQIASPTAASSFGAPLIG